MKWKESSRLFLKFLMNVFIAPITIAKVSAKLYSETEEKRKRWWPYAIVTVPLFLGFILCHILELALAGMWAIGWFFYLGFASVITAVRIKARDLGKINGNVWEDFFSSLFFYANVAVQLDETADVLISKEKLPEGKRANGKQTSDRKVSDGEKVNYAFEDETSAKS